MRHFIRWLPRLSISQIRVAALPLLIAAFPATTAAQDESLPLWEVTDGQRKLFLMGSVHMLSADAYPLNGALYDAFDEAEVMAFEVDIGEAAAAAPLLLSRGGLHPGESLRALIPEDLYLELERKAAEIGIPVQAFDSMKPWFASLMLNSVALQSVGFEAALGIDMHFYERGIQQGKQRFALETTLEQIEVFDGLTLEQQTDFLRSTIDDLGNAPAQVEEITAIWVAGDLDRLSQMMRESMGEQSAVLERLLFSRNRNWIPKIEELLAEESTAIVIVGLGHMIGDGGVTELLRERGYTVQRVTPVTSRSGR